MIEEIQSFIGTCDNCQDIFDNGEYSIFVDESTVTEEMAECDWFIGDSPGDHNGKHYCTKCFKPNETEDDVIVVDLTRKDKHKVHSPIN